MKIRITINVQEKKSTIKVQRTVITMKNIIFGNLLRVASKMLNNDERYYWELSDYV